MIDLDNYYRSVMGTTEILEQNRLYFCKDKETCDVFCSRIVASSISLKASSGGTVNMIRERSRFKSLYSDAIIVSLSDLSSFKRLEVTLKVLGEL